MLHLLSIEDEFVGFVQFVYVVIQEFCGVGRSSFGRLDQLHIALRIFQRVEEYFEFVVVLVPAWNDATFISNFEVP